VTTPLSAPWSLAARRAADPAPSRILRRTHYLHPGDLVACAEPATLATVLGSCVAVCLWDCKQGIGAMNHYLLPHGNGSHEQSSRFGSVAIARLLDRMLSLGSRRGDIEAKLFGGAWILAAEAQPRHVGALNVQVARERLGVLGIPIVAEDVGGARGRRLVFQTESGVVLVKKL
jgi:chemotaxis protein CheD